MATLTLPVAGIGASRLAIKAPVRIEMDVEHGQRIARAFILDNVHRGIHAVRLPPRKLLVQWGVANEKPMAVYCPYCVQDWAERHARGEVKGELGVVGILEWIAFLQFGHLGFKMYAKDRKRVGWTVLLADSCYANHETRIESTDRVITYA